MTSLLLLAVCSLPASSKSLERLALNSTFISGVGAYISHLDQSVRRCGMLAAEVVAAKAGKALDFGDWDGEDVSKPWTRHIRTLLAQRDADAEPDEAASGGDLGETKEAAEQIGNTPPSVQLAPRAAVEIINSAGYDSDDSLTGYASPDSSRANSPTPSELEEIERDPTIHVGIKKIPRPVYLAQLGELLRPSTGQKYDEKQEAEMMEMALSCAEELIRRKRDYGLELGMSFWKAERACTDGGHTCRGEFRQSRVRAGRTCEQL